jgi:hypothetical protein
MTFTTTQKVQKENGYTYKTEYTWQPTNHTLSPELIQSDYYIEYEPYTWYELSTRRYTNGLLHNTQYPTETQYIYKETQDYSQQYTLEKTVHNYHYHGTPIPETLEYAHKQTAINDTQYSSNLQTYNELVMNHDTAKQQQLYTFLDTL